MDTSLLIDNILNPPILFFFLGIAAVTVRSDLDIPQPIPKLLSLYLLFSIGFRGGVELNSSGIDTRVALSLGASFMMASIVPVYTFFILRRKLAVHDAAAIAATYGSISAVTFITASSFLQKLGLGFSGTMVAAMALMESPAIIIGVLMYRIAVHGGHSSLSWKELLRDAVLNGSVFLLIGSLVIGVLTGNRGAESLRPFSENIFKGVLSFFLLDMGLVAAKRLRDLKQAGAFLTVFAVVIPLVNAAAGILVAKLIGLPVGDALMFTVLCASASYIAVPAAVRHAIPEASPSLYVPMALAITFPFNIIIGLPLYLFVINALWR